MGRRAEGLGFSWGVQVFMQCSLLLLLNADSVVAAELPRRSSSKRKLFRNCAIVAPAGQSDSEL